MGLTEKSKWTDMQEEVKKQYTGKVGDVGGDET